MGGVPHPRSGVPSSWVRTGGFPILLTGGTPHPRSRPGGTPFCWQGGVPIPDQGHPYPRSGQGSTPSCWQGVLHPRSGQGGITSCWQGGYPHSMSGQGIPNPADRGTPIPSQVRSMGTPSCWQGVPPSQVRTGEYPSPTWPGMGVPPPNPGQDRRGYPQPEQHSVHLLRGGRCASCVHTRGLSCFVMHFLELFFVTFLIFQYHIRVFFPKSHHKRSWPLCPLESILFFFFLFFWIIFLFPSLSLCW